MSCRPTHACFGVEMVANALAGGSRRVGGAGLPGEDLKHSSYPRTVGQPAQPAWLAFDRQVLRFYAHFQESVHETNGENTRFRYCTILFYLEDDTIQVNEKATDNSGLNQGTLIRRHRVPKPAPDDDKFYTVQDLNVGAELTFYARTFALTSCDEFTKDFLKKLGIRVGQDTQPPADAHTTKVQRDRGNRNPCRPYEKVDTLKQFLEFDRKVLRFYCVWDDSKTMFGDRRYMVLLYYLANDTIEVQEVLPPNSGRDDTGSFFKRGKLPKDTKNLVKLLGGNTPRTVLNVFGKGITDRKGRSILDSLRTGAIEEEFYSDADLQIGSTIAVIGRPLLICDCDDFTKQFYAEKYGVTDFTPVNVEEPAPPPVEAPVPPPTGYGTEDDSMVSVKRLVLQPPKQFPGAWLPANQSPDDGCHILRFFAKMVTTEPLKVDRRFILSYFLVDDTVSVFELPHRNSGIPSGKFLERGEYKLDNENRKIIATDFFKGNTISVLSTTFYMIYADDYTYNFMEKFSDQFPFSDADKVLAKLAGSNEAESLKAKRPREDGLADAAAVREQLKAAAVVNEHEVETLVRAFAVDDGQLDYKALCVRL